MQDQGMMSAIESNSVCPECTTQLNGRERVEGLEAKLVSKEMDILKDLPSYNSSNFSRLLSHGTANTGKSTYHRAKTYVRLKGRPEDEDTPQVIVTDSESLILKELEALIARQQVATRSSLKRSSSCRSEHGSHSSSSSYKFPRTDMTVPDDEDSLGSWSFDT